MNSGPHLVQQSIFFITPFQFRPCILPLPRAVPTYPECPHDLTSESPILVCPDLSRSAGVSTQLLPSPLDRRHLLLIPYISAPYGVGKSQPLCLWDPALHWNCSCSTVSGLCRGTAGGSSWILLIHLILTLQPLLRRPPVSPAQSACCPPCPQMRSTQHPNGSSEDCF